jgi:hypothetical protein
MQTRHPTLLPKVLKRQKIKLVISPQDNYTDLLTTVAGEVSADSCGKRVLLCQPNESRWPLLSVFYTEAATISSN